MEATTLPYGYACECGRLEFLGRGLGPRSPEYKAMRRREQEHNNKPGHHCVGNPSLDNLMYFLDRD